MVGNGCNQRRDFGGSCLFLTADVCKVGESRKVRALSRLWLESKAGKQFDGGGTETQLSLGNKHTFYCASSPQPVGRERRGACARFTGPSAWVPM